MGKHSRFSLPGFTRLAPSIYVQDPRVSEGSHGPSFPSTSTLCLPPGPVVKLGRRGSDTAPPDLIVITSWTGASSKHVAKYTEAYNTLYPGVPILVITTVLTDLTLHSTKHKLKALAPAVAYLLSQEEEPVSTAFSSTSTFSQPYHDDQFPSTAAFFPEPYRDHPHNPQPHLNHHYPNQPHHHHHHPPTKPAPKPRFRSLLLHAFSEGGAHKATLLARAYLSATTTQTPSNSNYARPSRHNPSSSPEKLPPHHSPRQQKQEQQQQLPIHALILDSTPGRASFTRATTAFTRSLPGSAQGNALVSKVVGPVVAAGVVGVFWAGMHLRSPRLRGGDVRGGGKGDAGGEKNGGGVRRKGEREQGGSFIEETRRALNDESLWDVRGMARAYLYGEGDEVVGWEDVHDHGVESATAAAGGGEKGGVGSLMVRFKRTEHCAHARGVVNGAVYWAAVRRTWEMREDGGMGLRLGLGRRLSLDSLCWDGDGDDESW